MEDLRARIFNYRLSRARRVIENTFGILAARFRIFRRAIIGGDKMVTNITKACTVLHNYLMHDKQFPSNVSYCPPGFVDQERPQGTRDLEHGEKRLGIWVSVRQVGTNNYKRDAKDVREHFRDFFSESGQVPWQIENVTSVNNNFDL